MKAALVFFLAVALLGFAVAIVLSVRLRRHISIKRVREIDDPAKLYPNLIPPKAVLTDRGRILRRYMIMGIVVFVASLVLLAALSQLDAGR